MIKKILISQRVNVSEYEVNCSLSIEWTELFNNFIEIQLIPVHINTNLLNFDNDPNISGIIISGGNDIFIKKERFKSNKNYESYLRDNFETNLINYALDNNIPLLAICRGCQLLAYKNGFNILNNKNHSGTHHKLITINHSKYLNRYLKEFDGKVNSYHNQSIENLNNSENINVICKSEDNFVEALEYKNNKVLGIMWHPERNTSKNHTHDIDLIGDFFNLKFKQTLVLILCAGKGTRLRPLTNNVPKCMVKYKNSEIIDYILKSLRLNYLNDIVLIKGYLDKKLKKSNTKEIINKKYDVTNMVYTLFEAEKYMDGTKDIIISYSDIVYSPDIVKKLKESNENISVVIDKDWYNLWSQRMEDPLSDAETLKIDSNGYITEIGNKPKSYSEIQGQYIGLIKFKSCMVKQILDYYKKSNLNNNIYLTEFLTLISKDICPIKAVEINGGWAEFDTIEDLNYDLDVSWYDNSSINFGSKAENLYNLQDKLKFAKIANLIYFNYKEWNLNKNKICRNIQNKIKKKVIIRSSSLNEDTIISSNAGQFLTLNNINSSDSNELINSINKVFESYGKVSDCDQVLIQESLENITSCGVLFTFDCLTNSYYYTLTYDETGSSDSVTSGTNNNNQKCIYYVKNTKNIKNKYLKYLKKLSDQLELIYNNDKLDIEFAFIEKNNELILYLLQVRPLIFNSNSPLKVDELKLYHDKIFNKCKKYINNKCYDIYGEKSILSVMTDWNPAEIIGIKPKQLALSLYKEIITDNIAMKSRQECGYKDLTNHPLLISLINRPYIDTRISFSSLIPNNIGDKLSNKLCNYYLNKLENNPDLHDKVEFNICFTCNTINLKKKLNILDAYNFSNNEIQEINNKLIELTNNILSPEHKRIEKEYQRLNKLEKYNKNILKSSKFETDKIFELSQILKKYGTLPFSNLARFAFIGKSILLSFVEEKILTNERFNEFMESIHTISKDMSRDIYFYSKNEISLDTFLEKYGHLRPGTYDITSKRYDEDFNTYFSDNYINKIKSNDYNINTNVFKLTESEKKSINNSLRKSLFAKDINADNILYFIKTSTEAREYSKFVFSKTLSNILKLINDFIDIYNISNEEGAHLDFKIFNEIYSQLKLLPLKDIILENIKNNKKNYQINLKLNLPQVILNSNEIYEFEYINTKPTFISKKKIKTSTFIISDNLLNYDELENKIIIVSNADPGWEWLFSRNISGLITCYGGMNSHMAIRCQELSLPAVIGCGPEKYESYKKANIIELDCGMEIIRVIN